MSNKNQPQLRFLLSQELHEKTISTLEQLEQSDAPTQHHHLLSSLVEELIKEGMHYYFVKPQKLAGVGFIGTTSTNLGIEGFLKMSGPIVRKTFRSMDKEQLLVICGFIRELMS